jgi:hypothetical protein
MQCTLADTGSRFGAGLLLILWLLFLLHVVETTTNDYFVTSLQLAVAILNLSPNVRGDGRRRVRGGLRRTPVPAPLPLPPRAHPIPRCPAPPLPPTPPRPIAAPIPAQVAGVTFLAVGNAACDVIASVAAFATGVPKVGVGTTLGAGIFVTTGELPRSAPGLGCVVRRGGRRATISGSL